MNSCKDNILILGSNGLLGSKASIALNNKENNLFLHTRNPDSKCYSDLTDLIQVKKLWDHVDPQVILNCVALTDVERCENIYDAYQVNVKTTENIVDVMLNNNKNSYLLHISTDHIYDDVSKYNCESDVNLKNYYAFSKYTSEKVAQLVPSCILRTNFFGKSLIKNRVSFTDWILTKIMAEEQIIAFDDIYFNPLSMTTLIKKLDTIKNTRLEGVFNLGAKDAMSKADFIFSFAEEMSLPTKNIKKCSIDQVDFIKTYRPKGMQMDVNKIEHALSAAQPLLADEIKLVAQEYRNE